MSGSIISLLEQLLVEAKRNSLGSLAISSITHFGEKQQFFTGGFEKLQLDSVYAMAGMLQQVIENWEPPPTNPALDASCARYQTSYPGFDFLTWLVAQEMLRVKAGAPGPLKVGFWQGQIPVKSAWIDPVWRPMLGLVGAIEDNRAFGRPGEEIYVTKRIVEMFNEGIKVPCLKSTKKWDLPRGAITITLREAEHWAHRNSDVEAWTKFAKILRERGERVIFVRDTAKADQKIEDFESCGTASRVIDARLWLYQHAKMNYFVSNGPYMLAVFSKAPFVCFIPTEKQNPNFSYFIPNTPSFWSVHMGVDVGGQYPWSSDNQRIVWKRDTFENIMAVYEGQLQEAA